MAKGELQEPLKKIVTAARAARGGLQHLAVDGMGALQLVEPFGGASCALARTAEVEKEQGDGEGCEGEDCRPPGLGPGKDPGQQGAPHHRSPLRQSSTRAQIATAIPASASAMNTQRRVSR
jgi:hypothetical protein